MRGKDWETSPRSYEVTKEDIVVPVGDGIRLAGEAFYPDTDEPVPVILGAHPYNTEFQSAQIKPKSMGPLLGWAESGDPNYFARRGYAHVILNVRGTGRSDGRFRYLDTQEAEDVAAAIRWIADQPWCSGDVGMFGVSYFAIIQQQVAMLDPGPLKAIFAPWAYTDFYRDKYYHGGILSHKFLASWEEHVDSLQGGYCWSKEHLSDEEFDARVQDALADDEIYAQEHLVEALENPMEGLNGFITDVVLHRFDDEFYDEHTVSYKGTSVPAYLGAGWGIYGLHLPGAFRSWRNWEGPKKMLVGPDLYLDRPLYQLQDEAVRWFDHWLKDVDTGIMDEPPIRLFVMGTGGWKETTEWPLPETKWNTFYLHDDGLLFEREHWPNSGHSTFEESPFRHEELRFETPTLVEDTEVVGPIRLNLFASTTDTELLLFAILSDVGPDGETELTRGWLRGSQRKVDPERSTPWRAYHPHDERQELTPDEVYEFNVNLKPTANCFERGHRIGLTIKGADVGPGWDETEKTTWKQAAARGHLQRQTSAHISVQHNADYPSHLLLPVTRGNVMGTYYSGGEPSPPGGEFPLRKIQREKEIPDR